MNAREVIEAVAAAFAKVDDPGVSDLYDEQPMSVHLPLGVLRAAASIVSRERLLAKAQSSEDV